LALLVPFGANYPDPFSPPKATGWTRSYYYSGKNIFPEFLGTVERPNGEIVSVGCNLHLVGYHDDYNLEGVALVTSPSGSPRSFRLIGAPETDDALRGALNTADGGLLLYGASIVDRSTWRAWVLKVNGSWRILWQKAFGLKGRRFSTATAHEMKDGGFLIQVDDLDDFLTSNILKLSAKGSVQWQKKIPEPTGIPAFGTVEGCGTFQAISPSLKDGVLVQGIYNTGGFPSLGVFKINAAGAIVWAKHYPVNTASFPFAIHPRTVVATADGGTILGFMQNEMGSAEIIWNPYVLKIDSYGHPRWIVRVEFNAATEDLSDLWGAYPAPNEGAALFMWEEIFSEKNLDTLISVSGNGSLRFTRAWNYDMIPDNNPQSYAPTREGGQVGGKGTSIWKWDKFGWLSSECKVSTKTRSTTIPTIEEADMTPLPVLEKASLSSSLFKTTIRSIGLAGMTVKNNCLVKPLKEGDEIIPRAQHRSALSPTR
jgi:hypothetical protein